MNNLVPFDDQDLPPHLREAYKRLSQQAYTEETMDQFALFAISVAKYHRERSEAEDIDEIDGSNV